MLSRTLSHVFSQQPSCSGAPLRAPAVPLQQSRVLVVARTSYSAPRSSSPRSESWRSSWRTELDHGSNGNGNGNGNGVHNSNDADYYTAYSADSNGYHYHPSAEDSQQEDFYEAPDSQQLAYDYNGAAAPHESYPPTSGDDEVEEEGAQEGGFFTDAFKDALKAALQRSPLYADEYGPGGSGDEETVEPQPYESEVETHNQPIFTDQFRQVLKESLARQQTEMDKAGYGSDDEYTPTPYVPMPPPRREMSPIEEVIATALGASQLHLRRLTLMKNEIDAAIERETKQIERLDFALNKTQTDMAYYKTLEKMLEEERRKGK